jgi:hypothetical protein
MPRVYCPMCAQRPLYRSIEHTRAHTRNKIMMVTDQTYDKEHTRIGVDVRRT